ncbi:ATP-binding cassette domain-containing protein [Candidatus Woesearchaeota archaeon]|nr:ATP-binding cassette domain-containing protein [Candidatus Woesearchaeota archaeon]
MVDIIKVRNLKKYFKTFRKDKGALSSLKSLIYRDYVTVKAVDDISFDVSKGEIRGFIGPNGAGKSTTIKILSGILYPSSGKVRVIDYQPWDDRKKYVKNIGVVFGQKQQLWLDLPPVDTFYLNKTIYDIPEKKFEKNLNYFVELFELEEIIHRPARQLSLGEKMKCELISSLLHDPKIVFLDEPTIGLDLISKEKIRDFIKKVNKDKNITFLLTTHDIDDIENLCKNILIINKGKLVYDGTIDELKKDIIKTKILDIKFLKKIKKIKKKDLPENTQIVSQDEYEMKLKIDTKANEVGDATKKILEKFPIRDLNISNPQIESIIKKIYEN